MLTADMKERNCGRIELTNLLVQTGRDLLYYLYNGRMKDGSDIIGLLEVADQYDMQDLKTWCAEALAISLTDDTCFELLLMAQLHNVQLLKIAVIDYITENAGRLVQVPNWDRKIRNDPDLMKEVIEKFSSCYVNYF